MGLQMKLFTIVLALLISTPVIAEMSAQPSGGVGTERYFNPSVRPEPTVRACPLNLAGSHDKIRACGLTLNQCQVSCRKQECQPMVCSEAAICRIDEISGERKCEQVPCQARSCAVQAQTCGAQCTETYGSCVASIDNTIKEACGERPVEPARCRDWSSDLSNHECGKQKEVCQSRCPANSEGCRYNCIYSRVKCRTRIQEDLAVFCRQPRPEPPIERPLPIERLPSSENGSARFNGVR